MDKIRLGNDIEMRWSIFTRDGDNKVPYNLEGRALTLSVVNRTGESEIEFFAEGNIVTGVFRGRDQRILGKHGVILRENNGKDGMRTIDACDAFELVACSCEEALGSSGTIQLFHLTFDSTIGAITGTIDPILNYEAEQAEAERKANEIIRKANEEQRIDNEKQRNVNEILRNTAEEERENAEQERIVNEDLRKADEAERKTNEESRVKSESERVSSEEERLYTESIRVANENARIASEAKRKEAETARIEAEDKRIVSEKNRLSAESSRIANEDSRRANEDSRLSAEAKRVSAEEERVSAELERQAKFASMVVQSTGDATDKVMSQKAVTEALKEKQEKLVAGDNITIEGNVISSTGGGSSVDLSAYAKQADVDAALAGKQSALTDTDGGYGQRVANLEKTKQDTLTPGNGISIEGNKIGVTAITESESQPDTSLWLNPSEDEETDVTYNRSQIDAMVGAKQDALQLTVKDNGNIVLSNIQGQSKEFMPATPSGDPMHYAYEAAGAEWNGTGADIVKTAPWADLADDDADKTVTHKAGYWYLNGLGDITTDEIRTIYAVSAQVLQAGNINDAFSYEYNCRTYFGGVTGFVKGGWSSNNLIAAFTASRATSVNIAKRYIGHIDYMFRSSKIIYVIGTIKMQKGCSVSEAFKYADYLKYIIIEALMLSLVFTSPYLYTKCILYMIQNEAATSPITITLHADAYARAMANADIVAALEAHPNVSLASA